MDAQRSRNLIKIIEARRAKGNTELIGMGMSIQYEIYNILEVLSLVSEVRLDYQYRSDDLLDRQRNSKSLVM